MFKKFDNYDGVCFFNGLIFYAPVALLIRTQAGVSNATFFMLQALLSLTVFVGEIPTGFITDKIGYKKSIISAQITMLLSRITLLLAFAFHSIWLFVLEAVCLRGPVKPTYTVHMERQLLSKNQRILRIMEPLDL